MEQSTRYALQEAGKWLRVLCRSRLVRDGEVLPVLINGDAIDLEIAAGTWTVLASSYDYFDGCNHWIYLLRQDGRPIDQLRMPDQFGFIERVQRLSDYEISFSYLGTNDRWHLIIDEKAYWSFSPRALIARPNRFFLRRRHLRVARTKGPAWTLSNSPPSNAGAGVNTE